MWIALFAALFAPFPLLGLWLGLCELPRLLVGKPRWERLLLLPLVLTGRWWIRFLRPSEPDEPKPIAPTRRGTAVGWGGSRLEWEQFGPDDAPALLLSHGWSLTHDTWYYQKAALAGEFRVIVWDMRGTGRSPLPPDRDYSVNALLHDLAAVFEATQAGRHPQGCVLAGHSLGAMLLPLFAQAFPERMRSVRGLALLGGTDAPLLETMRGRRWLAPMRSWFWEPLGRVMGFCPRPFEALARFLWQTGVVHLSLHFGACAGRESRGQADMVARHCAEFSMRAAGLGALTCFALDARRAMPLIDVPVLLLAGEGDINMPPEIQRAMLSRLRDGELVLIPNCGHLNLLECHMEVNARLAEFARRCLRSP